MDSQFPDINEIPDLTIEKLGEAKIKSVLNWDEQLYSNDADKILIYPTSKELAELTKKNIPIPGFEIAGPRQKIFFDPSKISCGIVTCGGLCPGINDAIRTITLTLKMQYGVKNVFGFRYGYQGLTEKPWASPIELTTEFVDNINSRGGTILGSSRGEQDVAEMINTLLKYKISVLFTIGGDGTFKGANAIAEEIKKRNLPISIIGIPKTIDNDIMHVQMTFGLSTAVEKSREYISCAHEEAKAGYNGIGLLKLMGRDSGFIAMHATLANSCVNFCLVPEEPLELNGEKGFLRLLEKRLEKKNHAVIVVAEGTGRNLFKNNASVKKDLSGNIIYDDIGLFLKEKITEYFKTKNTQISLKYIDPSYIIRSVPADSNDSEFCLLLGQMAVHAGMCGKTNMFVGYWNRHFTHVPFSAVINKRKHINTKSPLWQIVLETTGQYENR